MRKRPLVALLPVFCIILTVVGAFQFIEVEQPLPVIEWPEDSPRAPEIQESIDCLQQAIAHQRDRFDRPDGFYTDYEPTIAGRLEDMATDAAGILRGLPGVVDVDVGHGSKPGGCNSVPTWRIVHFLDWHYVARDDYAADLRKSEPALTDKEIDLLHAELRLQCELVQLEQTIALPCLIDQHGLTEIWTEGLTREMVPDFLGFVIELNKAELRRKRIAELGGDAARTPEHALQLLKIGAVGQLMIEGKIDAVLPLDDAKTLREAKGLDQAKIEARQDAIVRTLTGNAGGEGADAFALIVLGGGHDLADNLPSGTEYIRVATRWYTVFSRADAD